MSTKSTPSLLFWFAFLAVLLSGCAVQRSVSVRAVAEPARIQAVGTPAERIVTLIPQTPPAALTPTSAPAGEAGPTPASIPPVVTPPAKPLADLGLQTSTYQDAVGGFAFDYPSSWQMTGPSDEIKSQSKLYSISLRSPDASQGTKVGEGFPPGAEGVDINVSIGEQLSYEDAVARRRQESAQSETPVKLLREEEWLLPSGLTGHYFLFDTQIGPVSELVLVIQGHPVLIAGLGTPSLFPSIAWSFRAE